MILQLVTLLKSVVFGLTEVALSCKHMTTPETREAVRSIKLSAQPAAAPKYSLLLSL